MNIYSYNRILFSYKQKRTTVCKAVPMGLSLSSSAFDRADPGLPLVPSLQPPPNLFSSLNLLISHLTVLASRTSWHWFLSSAPTASLVVHMVKNLPTMRETWVWFLGQEDPLEKGMATHSSILAWRIPWTEETGWLQSMGSQRVRHNWASNTSSVNEVSTSPT